MDEIVHDPYVLISILTAYHQGEWTLAEVEGTLSMLFERQYILTEEVVVETRYRTETSTDPETGETTSEQVPYADSFTTTEKVTTFFIAGAMPPSGTVRVRVSLSKE